MRKLLLSIALGAGVSSLYAITPLWTRDVRISPDGKEIAFCYKGDIYKVNANGGDAIRLTSQDSYESNPVWSPDGKKIAFASDRYGSLDLFRPVRDGREWWRGPETYRELDQRDSFRLHARRAIPPFLSGDTRSRRERIASDQCHDGII